MDTTSFLLVAFQLTCFSAVGILIGFQYIYAVEHDLKGVNKSPYFIYFVLIVIALFQIWVLTATGGFEKQNWMMDLLPVVCVILGFYFPANNTLKKKRSNACGQKLEP